MGALVEHVNRDGRPSHVGHQTTCVALVQRDSGRCRIGTKHHAVHDEEGDAPLRVLDDHHGVLLVLLLDSDASVGLGLVENWASQPGLLVLPLGVQGLESSPSGHCTVC